MPRLQDLPEEILAGIIPFVDFVGDLASLARIKVWHARAQDALWENVLFSTLPQAKSFHAVLEPHNAIRIKAIKVSMQPTAASEQVRQTSLLSRYLIQIVWC